MKRPLAINKVFLIPGILSAMALSHAESDKPARERPPQYDHEKIVIPPASANEEIRGEFSLNAATDYLERGALAWLKDRNCVACHTPGTYLQTMPELTPILGKPSAEFRDLFVSELNGLKKDDREKFTKGTRTAQVIYIAAGLAQWDKHVGDGKLSSETDEALRFMFELQNESGTWQSLDCWPPFESSSYQEATVAALAVAAAPTWLKNRAATDPRLSNAVKKLKTHLKSTAPPHLYARVLQLWAATQMDGILDQKARSEIIASIQDLQHEDGGWSVRDFAKPEQWGKGNREMKLREEPEFTNPPSDGHMTGLCVMVLREAGIPAEDEGLKRAVVWLLANQRESGRWWTRSLNTDKYHFITYSGTAYPVLALARCGALTK